MRVSNMIMAMMLAVVTSVHGATGSSEWFYVNTTDVKVRLVATEGVLVDEDGNPVKDENGKFITEVTQEFPRDKSVSLMKNPFKRGSNIFLGWSRYPDVDLRTEVYDNKKSLDQVLYRDEASLYFDAENPEEEVTLYAIWTVSLTCSFNNLEPEDLKNHLYWQCLGRIVDGEPEWAWHNCRDGEYVELLPGEHDIYFRLKEGYSWIVDEPVLLRMKESIHLPSGNSGPVVLPMLGPDPWVRIIEVDVPYVKGAQSETGKVRFKCIPETSRTLGYYASLYPFDLSKVTIEVLPLYSYGHKIKPIEIATADYVTLPAGKYQALISYDNSASSGEGFSWYATEGWSSYYCGFEVDSVSYYKVIPVNFALQVSGLARQYCTVRFEPEKGTVDVGALNFMRRIREDVNQPLKNAVITYLPEPKRKGKRFIGWWTKPKPSWMDLAVYFDSYNGLLEFWDKGQLVEVGDEISEDCTLYARWVNYDSSLKIDEDKLTGVVSESSIITMSRDIRFISVNALELVEDAKCIVFEGGAPEVDEGAFEKLPADSVVYVKRSSSGWNTDIPGIWKGVKIEYVDDVIPAIANESEIRNVFSGMADGERLSSHIKDVDGYNYFRIWSMYSDNINPLEVKSSPNAWLSYALDADELIAAAPKEGDIVIDTFESAETDWAFEFTVKIDGIEVGDNALEANIRKVFDIEGAEKLVSGGVGFTPDNVEVNASAPENGTVKFAVTPKMENGEKLSSFFIRVKMK